MKNKIRETKLPGVGVQLDFEIEQGHRVGVIAHNSGRRDFLVFSADDPDKIAISTNFTEEEAALVGEMMGASQVVQALNNTIQQAIGGLSLDWIEVQPDWPCIDASIKGLGLYQTGTNIIAVIRGEKTFPAAESDLLLQAGDNVVVIGKPEGIKKAHDVMAGAP
jgi:TrkA domain protein